MNYEKKTYTSFLLSLSFTVLLVPILGFYLKNLSINIQSKIILSLFLLWTDFIGYIVYKKQRIYWISSYDYETSIKIPSSKRKEIGLKFFKIFLTLSLIFFIYALIGTFLETTILVDGLVFVILLVTACFIKV